MFYLSFVIYVCFKLPLEQNFAGSGAKDQEERSVKGAWSMCSMTLLAEIHIITSFCS